MDNKKLNNFYEEKTFLQHRCNIYNSQQQQHLKERHDQ